LVLANLFDKSFMQRSELEIILNFNARSGRSQSLFGIFQRRSGAIDDRLSRQA
jgi:hypothetical protein